MAPPHLMAGNCRQEKDFPTTSDLRERKMMAQFSRG